MNKPLPMSYHLARIRCRLCGGKLRGKDKQLCKTCAKKQIRKDMRKLEKIEKCIWRKPERSLQNDKEK